MHDGHDLVRETIAQPVGQAVPLEIVRGGQHYGDERHARRERPEQPVEPTPAQQPVQPRQGLGLVVRDLAPAQAAQMGLPSQARCPSSRRSSPGSVADREGLRVGDVIVEANGDARTRRRSRWPRRPRRRHRSSSA